MTRTHRWTRVAGLAAFMSIGAALPALASGPASPVRIRVTQTDVDNSNAKLAGAYSELVKMWQNDFARIGARFAVPHLVRYRGAARTACGIMGSGNAAYCSTINAIYYDEVFVAGQAKAAASRLGTDGDMAGIGIIAHEMGHAVATQLHEQSRDSYENESTADCLAGAFALQSQRDGFLDPGDLDEAFFGMAAAGDPAVELTGNNRIDNRILASRSRRAHGTSEQRTSNFKSGYDGGAGACLPEFGGRR